MLVGESTELFPTSKATTLESNKSLTRPHQSSLSTASGNETHSRPRRSVDIDGHASVTSVPSDSVTVDKMHEITSPSVDGSLAHGVESASGDIKEGNASVGDADLSNTGDLTTLQSTTAKKMTITEKTTSVPTSMVIKSTTITQAVPKITKLTTKNAPTIITKTTITDRVTTDKITNIESRLEHPLEISESTKEPTQLEKDHIAYDPKDMQSDAFPSIYSYGAQKLQYLKLLTRLNQVNEELHINLKDAVEPDENLKKFKYDSEKSTTKVYATIAPFINTEPTAILETPITNKPSEPLTPITKNSFVAQLEHVVTTTPTPIVHNSNIANMTTDEPTTEKVTITVDEKTVNTPEQQKTMEPTNPKHVLINLTISSDDADNASYKPIYSLTLTVPTLGDTNEIPTVKITPMDVEPTQPSNFNKPATLEGSAKPDNSTNPEDWGGICECSCPVCNNNTTGDDFYDEYNDNIASTETAKRKAVTTTESAETYDTAESSTVSEGESTTYSGLSSTETSTDDVTSTTDFTSETDTEVPCITEKPCVCPKVEPPPILILEGEVDLNTIRDNLLTVTTTING